MPTIVPDRRVDSTQATAPVQRVHSPPPILPKKNQQKEGTKSEVGPMPFPAAYTAKLINPARAPQFPRSDLVVTRTRGSFRTDTCTYRIWCESTKNLRLIVIIYKSIGSVVYLRYGEQRSLSIALCARRQSRRVKFSWCSWSELQVSGRFVSWGAGRGAAPGEIECEAMWCEMPHAYWRVSLPAQYEGTSYRCVSSSERGDRMPAQTADLY